MDWDPSQDPWDSEDPQCDAPPGFTSPPQHTALASSPCTASVSRPAPSTASDWDMPVLNPVSKPVMRNSASDNHTSRPQNPSFPPQSRAPVSVSGKWDLPDTPPTQPENGTQGESWMRSYFTESQPKKGKYRNDHLDQQEGLPQLHLLTISNPDEKRFHGDIHSNKRETVTIIRRTANDEMVVNEHGSDEFHSEDIPIDPSLLQTTGTFRADVDWSSFHLPPPLLATLQGNNLAYPSKVQAHAIRLILEEPTGHVLVQAPTGSGKTLAFVLATLSKLTVEEKKTQVICVAPTNELLLQLSKEFNTYGSTLGVTVSYVNKMNRDVSAQILLSTPAQCINLFRAKGALRAVTDQIKFLILDEADHLLNQEDQPEFYAHMETVIKELLPPSTRVLMFSATYSDPVISHIKSVLGRYTEIRVEKEELVLDNIKQYYITKTTDQAKTDLLISILREQVPGVTVVFINTGRFAQIVYQILHDRGYKCALLIGKNMTTEERFRTLEDFKRGFYTILLTTNVLARGIDNTHVSRVINYDIPVHFSSKLVDAETYLHRIGRSGRFNRPGIAISIVTTSAETYMLEEVRRNYGQTCVIENIQTDEEMKAKVKSFAEEVALLDSEDSA